MPLNAHLAYIKYAHRYRTLKIYTQQAATGMKKTSLILKGNQSNYWLTEQWHIGLHFAEYLNYNLLNFGFCWPTNTTVTGLWLTDI